jgi:hypothetical protein
MRITSSKSGFSDSLTTPYNPAAPPNIILEPSIGGSDNKFFINIMICYIYSKYNLVITTLLEITKKLITFLMIHQMISKNLA